MERSVAAITAGLLSELKKLDTTSNNLANVNTPGFKRDETFSDWMSVFQLNARIGSGAAVDDALALEDLLENRDQDGTTVEAKTILEQGPLVHTGDHLDLALVGEGFFVLQQGDREIYTRRGRFHLDEGGNLVSTDGYPVLGFAGPIQIPRETPTTPYAIRIDDDGSIYNNDQLVGTFQLVRPPEGERLTKIARTAFTMGEDAKPESAVGRVSVRQGYIESSNVEVVKEMTDMINSVRTFEAYQKILQTLDDLRGRLIQTVSP